MIKSCSKLNTTEVLNSTDNHNSNSKSLKTPDFIEKRKENLLKFFKKSHQNDYKLFKNLVIELLSKKYKTDHINFDDLDSTENSDNLIHILCEINNEFLIKLTKYRDQAKNLEGGILLRDKDLCDVVQRAAHKIVKEQSSLWNRVKNGLLILS